MEEDSTSLDIKETSTGFRAARRFFDSGATGPLEFRLAALARLEGVIIRRTDEILAALAADLGKPAVEAYLAEVHFVVAEIRLVRRRLRSWARARRRGHPYYLLPSRSEVRREPYGVALVAAPWNYPFQLSLSPVVAALAGGNAVVLKPSEHAPATADLLKAISAEVFESGHVVVVGGGADLGKALLEEPFDFFFYTGGERVGRLYAEAAARRLAPIVLELGGKCPCVLAPDLQADRDLDLAVRRIVAAKFFNAGQTCVAPDFVLLPTVLRQAFVAKARQLVAQSHGEGRPRDLARIVNKAHYRRLLDLVSEDAIQIGEDDETALLLAPRLLPRADWDDPAMKEEIFGPVLPIVGYDSWDEALARLAARPDPLALYAFSRDRSSLERIAGALRSGTVCFNDVAKQSINLELPFGGIGASGMGRYRGRSSFEAFTWARSVTRRYWIRDPFALAPPYGEALKRMRRFLE